MASEILEPDPNRVTLVESLNGIPPEVEVGMEGTVVDEEAEHLFVRFPCCVMAHWIPRKNLATCLRHREA